MLLLLLLLLLLFLFLFLPPRLLLLLLLLLLLVLLPQLHKGTTITRHDELGVMPKDSLSGLMVVLLDLNRLAVGADPSVADENVPCSPTRRLRHRS